MSDNKKPTRPKLVFINNVDRYSSKHLAQFLSRCRAEDSDEAEEEEQFFSPGPEPAFLILGSVSATATEGEFSFLHKQYVSPSREELLQCLLQCDVVVFNTSEDTSQQQIEEATWALTALQAEMENFESKKKFILVSTVMTWAATKPRDPDEIELPLTEKEFLRRRPHPSFRNHNNLEKLVLRLPRGKKSKLRGYVVASGLQYGNGENIFHYFFKVSWQMQLPRVPVFGSGMNYIPMIHVNDLGSVIQNIIEFKPRLKSRYIFAVDDSKHTLMDIIKAISDALGSGKVDVIPENDAITMKAFEPEDLRFLSVDLRLNAFIIKDSFSLHWTSEAGLVENIRSIMEEYKNTRQLLPIRICLLGPPAVGKSTVAKKLCTHYQIQHIKIKDVIDDEMTKQRELANTADDSEDVDVQSVAAARKQLEDFNKSMEVNSGRLAEHQVFDLLKEKLYSKACMNQGFVLEGFPNTYEQARLFFSDEIAKNHGTKMPTFNKIITPEFVFELNASDEFLMKRVQELPQSVAEEHHYTQEEFPARLKRYRKLFTAEETLLDYFDEIEIHPERIDVTTDDPQYTGVIKKITRSVGAPKNYGLSPEEQEEKDRKEEEERKVRRAEDAAEKKQRNEAALAEMAVQYQKWKTLCEVKKQEQELLEARCLPLRNYLMQHVMPSLSEAMLECSKIKPDDPVDFLAEYLLRNNGQEQE